MRQIKLTPKQQATLDFIRDSIAKNAAAPTINMLRESLGLRSLRSVTQRLEALEAKGFIKRDPFKHRGISLLHPMDAFSALTGTERIPVIASAGCDMMQVYAEEKYDEFLVVEKKLLDHRKEVVAIKAIGNSMLDAGIQNGDYVLVEVTGDVHTGDRIVAIVGEMAVIKRLKQVEGATVLEPESKSSQYSPIVLSEGFSKIFGKVLSVIPMSANKRGNETEYVYE